MIVTLGNTSPVEVHHHDPSNPDHVRRLELRGGTIVKRGAYPDGTEILDHVIDLDPVISHTTWVERIPDDWSVMEIVHTIAGLNDASASHVWAYHSKAKPGFVLVEGDEGDKRVALVKAMLEDIWSLPAVDPGDITALVTNAGLDYASKQLGGAASASAVAVNMALTANATAPAAGDTSLTGEITTAGGGLLRAACAYAHTAAAATYTLTKTFTANGSDSLPVTVNKMGIFDATSAGNMPFETAISPAITFNASGDQGTITETVTV